MRKYLIGLGLLALTSSMAMAADLPVRAPVVTQAPVVQAAYNWSGFYAGLHAGYAWGDASVRDLNGGVAPGPFGYKPDGAVVGGQVGYNYQYGNLVFGPEIDLGYADLSGKGVIGSASATAHQDLTLSGGFYANVAARVGYAFGNWLPYIKAGYAYYDGSAKQQTTNPGYVATAGHGYSGYTVGGGVEYALSTKWRVKTEYMFTDLGSVGGYQTNVSDVSSPIGYRFNNTTDLKYHKVTVGFNYAF